MSSAKSTTCSKSSRRPSPALPRSSRARSCRRCAEIEENLEKLRRDRERLGAVNLRAEEELREVEAQHTTLTTERDDLVEAIKRLRQGIQSLNREARERLLTSFEIVNEPLQAAVHRAVRRRRGRAALDRERRSAGGWPRDHRQAAGQEAADAVAALGRRAGADGAGADLRGVPRPTPRRSACWTRSTRRSTTTTSNASATSCTR